MGSAGLVVRPADAPAERDVSMAADAHSSPLSIEPGSAAWSSAWKRTRAGTPNLQDLAHATGTPSSARRAAICDLPSHEAEA